MRKKGDKGTPRAHHITPGTRFGKLIVVRRDGRIYTSAAWLCQCDCGNTARVRYTSLRRGETVSCGCSRFAHPTHGMKNTPEWKSWDSAIQRTTNPNHKSFHLYGGRGIRVCDKWRQSFEAFYADMGPRPSTKHSLDRYPNQDGDYDPGNCRWATWVEQANNRRNTPRVTIGADTKSLSEWARVAGLSHTCIYQRFKKGITGEALLLPSKATKLREAVHG